jgi:hypothetical protein
MLFTSSPAAKAAERYYLIVFGAQKSINVPKDSHTFGLFVKETDQGSLETICISWLAEDLNATILRRRPLVGVNLDLHFTMQHYESRRCRISMWGPFEMDRPETTYPQLISRLGLDQYCIQSRDSCARPHSPFPILPPYYDPSLAAEGPRGVEAPTPAAGQSSAGRAPWSGMSKPVVPRLHNLSILIWPGTPSAKSASKAS